jgi:hypothetical protein
MISDPHAALRTRAVESVLDGPALTSSSLRHAAAERAELPPELRELIDKIHNHAYRVTNEDITRLQATYSDDQLFEIIVSAALGASGHRLAAGLRALEEA